jgi:protein-disulfide isomerase
VNACGERRVLMTEVCSVRRNIMTAKRSGSTRAPVRVAGGNRRSAFVLAGIAIVAMAVVIAFVIFQATGSSSDKLPARTTSGQGRILGDPNAPVTLVEYADFQCPVCKRAETSLLPEIEKDYIQTGKVKLEFRMYPFIGQESWNAAQAADAAGDQGKFWEYHDALFNAQGAENGGNFTFEKLVAIAERLGLDVQKFSDTLSANTHLKAIQKEKDAANGVSSTPTFFVTDGTTDKKIVGVQAYGVFKAAFDEMLAKVGQ